MRKGSKTSDEQRRRVSEGRKGQPAHNKGKLKSGIGGKFCEACQSFYTCDTRIGHKRWLKQGFCSKSCALKGNKRTIGMFLGEKNPSWKGGITPIHMLIRSSTSMNEWRKAIFERDDYTCKECGLRGGKLHAHHILSFSQYPEKRLDIDNGETLCVECHKKTDNYAGRGRIYTTRNT